MIYSLLPILRRITMYRLMLYVLIVFVVYGIVLSGFGLLPYSSIDIFTAALYLNLICYLFNKFFAFLFKVKVNPESQFITALILTLLIGPLPLLPNIMTFSLAALAAMASKYLLVWRKRHIFNPAAFGVLATALILDQSASWWGGSTLMLPIVLLGGLVVLTKINRWQMVGLFLIGYLALFGLTAYLSDTSFAVGTYLYSALFISPLIFFAVIMLVEPQTAPSHHQTRLFYAIMVAAVLVAYQRLTSIPYSLELALLTGNILTRFMQPTDRRYRLKLIDKKEIAANTVQFKFEPDTPVTFTAGQFFEWTLPHPNPDERGIRRFFTIAASPTEDFLMIATRIGDRGSTFKSALNNLKVGESLLTASHLDGDFVLPADKSRKLVLIAGGIGITPFRSMIKYLLDSNEKRDIVLFYSNKTEKDIAFRDLFTDAEKEVGLKTVYTITDEAPDSWSGKTGFIDQKMIEAEVPDYKDRIFYISGPEPMVEAFEKMIAGMGIADNNIKRDFFPGYTETHQTKT